MKGGEIMNHNGQLIRITPLSFQELKGAFYKARSIYDCSTCSTNKPLPRCFYVEEIGVIAITENSDEAIDFLIKALNHTDKFVRFNAYGHLGGVNSSEKKEAIIIAIESGIKDEGDEIVLGIARKSLAKLKEM